MTNTATVAACGIVLWCVQTATESFGIPWFVVLPVAALAMWKLGAVIHELARGRP